MAVDLFCYSSLKPEEAARALELMASQHPGLFYERFLISSADEPGDIQKEIALEHGLAASSGFVVSLREKCAADLVPTALAIIRSAFGEGGVIIFSGGVLR